MDRNSFVSLPFDRLDVATDLGAPTRWLWHGYLARGNITLLTSLWKAGKTTTISGLLQRLGAGGEFLGRPCFAGRVLYVSEEPREMWAERLRLMPVGPHAELLARPFRTRPGPDEWNALIDHAHARRAADGLDLFVVDTLAAFLPGHSDSDVGALMTMLQPLQRLASEGVAVLLLHHPRRKPSEEGSTARGSGALLGYVDIILELHRFSRLASEERRRKLIALSRHTATPRALAFEWNPDTAAFTVITDLESRRFRENWDVVRALLAQHKSPATRRDLLDHWPDEQRKPNPYTLWQWLTEATAKKLCIRLGAGTRTDPHRYRLRNDDDAYYERGELPPLRPLPGMID